MALFFLGLFLLNIAGYYLVFEGWRWRNSITWSFNEENSSSQELIVSVPLAVPYMTREKDWEKSEGEFEFKGEIYRIVRQKFTLDAVYFACVKDPQGSQIRQQLEDFAKTFSDKPADGKQDVKGFPGFIKEYISQTIALNPSSPGWSLMVGYLPTSFSLVQSFYQLITHPPEMSA